eukprot:scaffold836_cov77-Skeletonema_dohrnii-CCMP3373.AAC.1
MTTGWCKLATKALEATKEQKRKRLRNEEQHLFDDGTDTVVDDTPARRQIRSKKSQGATTTESELFAKHQKKFQELDDLISHGDGGIEVMHSTKAGAHSAFAEVLESPPSSSTSASGLLKLRDGTVVEVARRRGRGSSPFSRIPRKTNRRSLLRKLSSRVVSFSKQAR